MDMKEIMKLLYKNYTTKGMVCGKDLDIDCDECPFKGFYKCPGDTKSDNEW